MPITREECLSNAHDFELWAKQAASESDRVNFLAMASLWTRLALNAGNGPTSANVVSLALANAAIPPPCYRTAVRPTPVPSALSKLPPNLADAEQELIGRAICFCFPGSSGPFMKIALKERLCNGRDFERNVASSVVALFPERSAHVVSRPRNTSLKLADLEQENADLRRYVVDLALQIQDLKIR